MMRKYILISLFSIISLLLIFFVLPQKISAQRCSTLNQPCRVNDDCRPTGENACSNYVCAIHQRTRNCLLQGAGPGGRPGSPVQPAKCPDPTVNTALGVIPVCDLNEFAEWFLRWALGVGGGVAFLLIIKAGFEIMTSTGNPDRMKGGQEQLTAAITGLVFLIFSAFLLRFIGVDILQLPGFGR